MQSMEPCYYGSCHDPIEYGHGLLLEKMMGFKLKHFLAIGVLFFVLSGCASPGQPTVKPTLQSTAQPSAPPSTLIPAPAATETITPNPATTAPAPAITSLHMLDANNGWGWTDTQRLLRTSDGGLTWMDRTPGKGGSGEEAFFSDMQTGWIPIFFPDTHLTGLFHTTDGGQTWSQISYDPVNGVRGLVRLRFRDGMHGWANEEDVFMSREANYHLSETQDGGVTWKPIAVNPPKPELGLAPGMIHLCELCNDRFYYDPSRMIIVYGDMELMQPGGSVRLQVSFDLGKNWQMQNLPLPKESADAAVAPYEPIFFDDKNGLLPVDLVRKLKGGEYVYQRLVFYATQDGGTSWSLRSGVLDHLDTPNVLLNVVSPQDVYAHCGHELCASHDGAGTWQVVASNLDFSMTYTGTTKRTLQFLSFLNASTGWVSVKENEVTTLYKSTDGGQTWTQITPRMTEFAPVTVNIDPHIPIPTLIPTATPEPTDPSSLVLDSNTNAYRIRFAPNATWVEVNDTIAAKTTRRYVLSATQGQMMGVSILQGLAALSVEVAGADKKLLSDSRVPSSFWRGSLPSTQDYILTVASYAATPLTMRVSINPPEQAAQNFSFSDKKYQVALNYTDEFATILAEPPAVHKGASLLTLTFIDPAVYFPTTNLGDSYLMLNVAEDPAIVATCTQPSTHPIETVTGQVTINGVSFTRAEVNVGAAGNFFDQISYRTVFNNKCFEVIFLFHSINIGSYSPGSLVEFDRAALIKKFEAVFDTFLAK